ncbi:MAG: octaprenyl-diphosphate synthase [Sulfurovum sp. PC08-66]|nr:MAG: octaprenyl-diphosphate synthase [Sulfurovum sp. PC08-66]KIM12376.1 MAG: octaprenyl-diphosphate synthase [Sulfuricurvum sp. PC08-66]
MIEAVEATMLSWVQSLNDPRATSLFAQMPAGKRLRAKLVMMIAPRHPHAVTLASVVELIHAASLLHDDVIDEAQLRRGKPSVNATQGSKTAIMMGDILYSKAYKELAVLGVEITQRVAHAVTQLSLGEMRDVVMGEAFNSDESAYIEMIYQKTASLIEATTACAALLAGKDVDAHALYGKNLGLAFQIIDDILDITSDEATLGKPVMSDFREGKTTLPYIYLASQPSLRERVVALHGKALQEQERTWLMTSMQEQGVITKSYDYAKALSLEAIESVEDEALHGLLHTLLARAF